MKLLPINLDVRLSSRRLPIRIQLIYLSCDGAEWEANTSTLSYRKWNLLSSSRASPHRSHKEQWRRVFKYLRSDDSVISRTKLNERVKGKSADRSGGPWKISQRSTLSRLKAGSFRLLNAFDMAAFGLSLILVKGGERLEKRIYSCSLGSHGQWFWTILDLHSVFMIKESLMNNKGQF